MLANPTVRRRRPATLDLCRVELSLLASHCCSAADQAGHSLHTAQTGSHTGHTELAGQPHGATPYLCFTSRKNGTIKGDRGASAVPLATAAAGTLRTHERYVACIVRTVTHWVV